MKTNQWPFFEYDRIAEKAEKWALDESLYRQIQRARWVVSEKIHGANFSFVTDGKRIRCAKRKGFLSLDEDFYDYETVLARIEEDILSLFEIVQERESEVIRAQLYGELFGGKYPGIESNPKLQPIQTGIYYSPRIEFCAFDLAIETETERRFVSFEMMQELLDAAELFRVEPLVIGTYESALAYPIGFESAIPKRLGLPNIPGNLAEGIVIKPTEPIYVETEKGRARVVLKKKIAAFSEDEKFFEAQKWSGPDPTSPLALLSSIVPGLANQNRLQSARSKIGQINTPQRAAQLFQLFVADILLQLDEDYSELMLALSEKEKKRLKRAIEAAARTTLKE